MTPAGRPAVSTAAGFADVSADASYLKAVAWAKAQGIVKGVTGTAFQPDETITQAQFAAMLTRYAAVKGKAGASVSATPAQGLSYAKSNGLLTGHCRHRLYCGLRPDQAGLIPFPIPCSVSPQALCLRRDAVYFFMK